MYEADLGQEEEGEDKEGGPVVHQLQTPVHTYLSIQTKLHEEVPVNGGGGGGGFI